MIAIDKNTKLRILGYPSFHVDFRLSSGQTGKRTICVTCNSFCHSLLRQLLFGNVEMHNNRMEWVRRWLKLESSECPSKYLQLNGEEIWHQIHSRSHSLIGEVPSTFNINSLWIIYLENLSHRPGIVSHHRKCEERRLLSAHLCARKGMSNREKICCAKVLKRFYVIFVHWMVNANTIPSFN